MSLQVNKESGSVYDPVFLKILEDIPGGVTVKTDRFPSTTKEVKKGALLNDGGSGLYNVIKTVRTTAAGATNTTILAIEPTDHLFVVGDFIFLQGGTGGTITRVSTTAIEVEVAHNAIASGAVLHQVSGVDTATALYDADAVLRDTVEVRKDGVATLLDNIFAGAVVRGTVDESEMPYFVTAADKVALTARIRFA